MVVEPDDSAGGRGRDTPGLLRLVLGGAGAVGLIGLLVWAINLNSTVLSPSTTATTVPLAAPTTSQSSFATSARPTTTTLYPRELGPLADLVPGVTGTLYAVKGAGIFEGLAWESDRGSINRWRLPTGWTSRLEFDVSNHRYGFITNDPTSGESMLSVRPRSGLGGLDLPASSFTWHQTIPSAMAAIWSAAPPQVEKAELAIINFELDGQHHTTTVADIGKDDLIISWTDSGFLIARYATSETNAIILLDQSGNQVWERQADLAWPSAQGDILLGTQTDLTWTLTLVDPYAPADDPGQLLTWAPTEFTNVGWSTDGQQLAFLIYEGGGVNWRLEIYDRQGVLLHSVSFPWRAWDVQWSPDDRFVLMPGGDNLHTSVVLFYDTQTEMLTPVEFDGPIQWADLVEADTTLIDLHTAQGPNSRIEVLFDSPGLDGSASDVSINISTDVDIDIWFHTSAGNDIRLLDGPPKYSPFCVGDGTGYVCHIYFETLEAETAGYWTLTVDNHSPQPVELDILASRHE